MWNTKKNQTKTKTKHVSWMCVCVFLNGSQNICDDIDFTVFFPVGS